MSLHTTQALNARVLVTSGLEEVKRVVEIKNHQLKERSLSSLKSQKKNNNNKKNSWLQHVPTQVVHQNGHLAGDRS